MSTQAPVDLTISERIDALRFIMILGIVVLHIPPYVPLTDVEPGVFSFVKSLLSNAIFRSTVPVLTSVSGFLLFRSGLDRDIKKLIGKKTKTLLVPLILWNLPLLLVLYLLQSNEIIDYPLRISMLHFDLFQFFDGLVGLTHEPINFPLWFLRDLFVLSLFSPVIGMALRYAPWTGLFVFGWFFWSDLDGPVLMRNTMLINFYLGGMAACRSWDIERLDRYAPFLAGAFLACCLAVAGFKITDRSWLVVLSPVLVWPASVWLVGSRVGRLAYRVSRHSFFLFLAHGPILVALLILYRALPGNVPYVVFYVLAPVIVVVGCVLVDRVLFAVAPGMRTFLVGEFGRTPREPRK